MNRYQKMNPLVWHRKQLGLALLVLLALVTARPLWRALAAAGDYDTSFSGDGKIDDFSELNIGAEQRIAIQHDGKMLAWTADPGYTEDFEFVRFKLNGELDDAFSGDGKVTTGLGDREELNDIAIHSKGKIVAVGDSIKTSDTSYYHPRVAIVRYLPNGNLDTSFSEDGKLIGLDFVSLNSVVIQSDSKIVVAGGYYLSPSHGYDVRPVIARYNWDGTIDTSFGFQGYVFVFDGLGNSKFHKIMLQTDGKILAASSGGMQRFLPSGQLDTTFGTNGTVYDYARDFVLSEDGKLVTLGNNIIRRRLASGALDTAFTETSLAPNNIYYTSLAIQGNGSLIAVGHPYPSDDTGYIAKVERNGALDLNFCSGGYKTLATPYLTDVALMADQRILITGHDLYPNNYVIFERYKNDNTDAQTTDVSVGAITTSSTAINPGDTFYYTIPVKNLSATKAAHVTLKTNVPSGTSYVGASTPPGWAVLQQPSVGAMGIWSASTYELAPGETANLFFFVKVSPSTPHGVSVLLAATGSNTIQETSSNNNTVYKVVTVQ